MDKKELQCLFIGEQSKVYEDLLIALKGFSLNIQARLVVADKKNVVNGLKRLQQASLIFISDEVAFSVESLSDLVWQYAADAVIVIVTTKTISTPLKTPFNSVQFSKLHFQKESDATDVHLQYLIQIVQIKWDFRQCKRLLAVSEKRCQWLVESSNQAIAFISRDMHLYANTSYLKLLGIDSIYKLPALPVSDLIVSDEYALFKSFVRKQLSLRRSMNHSLLLSLRGTNGKVFRANIHVIPSVFKGNKCLQLWVLPLQRYIVNQQEKDLNLVLEKKLEKKRETLATIFRGLIERKEVTISVRKLVDMKPNEYSLKEAVPANYLLSFKIPVSQVAKITDSSFGSKGADSARKRQIFWDKVKITSLFQTLIDKKSMSVNLFIRLSEASLTDPSFAEWILPGLHKIGEKSSHLRFILPLELDQKHAPSFENFVKTVRQLNCQIVLDDFSVSSSSLSLLKYLEPEYVRLSLGWLKQIEGNESREIALSSFNRQIEAKNIKIIAPSGVGADMRKLLIFSGVSFCQERT